MNLDEKDEQPVAPRWAPRVPRWKIARLYENDAKGVVDEDLIDDIAYAFLERCQSMVAVAEAHRGRAPCAICGEVVTHNWDKKGKMRCAACGWTGQWEAYWRSYKGKRLKAGGLEPFCQDYIRRLPQTRAPQEKVLLIDWLIHRFHWEGREGLPGRPGAVGLIGGTAHEVDAFLDALNLGDSSHPEIRESHTTWRSVSQACQTEGKQKQEARRRGRAEKRKRQEAKRKRRAERVQQRTREGAGAGALFLVGQSANP